MALGGPDTTSRLQTAWQVRVLPDVGAGATCATPDADLQGWLEVIAPSSGRLTTRAIGVASEKDPCLIPPSGGYRGLDNRTYRVEIQEGGAVGKATFKWSRDNASLATGVSAIENDLTLTVDRTLWDSARRFKKGDWIEITDNVREFSGAAGELRRIANDVEDGTRRITLDAPLPAGDFPVVAQNLTMPERATRIKRWDQTGIVRQSNGDTYVDLDAAGGTGLIDVPPAGTSLLLEDGVEVTFTTTTNGGAFRPGDYWIFAARTADASVEELEAAPPRGVHHHYCRLALVTLPNDVLDCRHFWPPPMGEGESCDCTLCVTADEHNQGTFTIYQAVAQIAKTGGTICLGPGIFNLQQTPVQLQSAYAVRIRGQGAATVLLQPRADAAFVINQSQWCVLDYLTIHTIGGTAVGPSIRLSNSVGTTIERLIVGPPTTDGNGPKTGISLGNGFLTMTKIRDNLIWAQTGVEFAAEATTFGPADTSPPKVGSNPVPAGGTVTAAPASSSRSVAVQKVTGTARVPAANPEAAIKITGTTTTSGSRGAETATAASGGQIGIFVPPTPPATGGTVGTVPPPPAQPALVLSAFYCEDNLMRCSDTGVDLGAGSFYLNATVIARNLVYDSEVAGISVTGFAAGELEITGNAIAPQKGDGIVIGCGSSRIADNQITNFDHDAQNGIRIVPGTVALSLFPLVVRGNRLQGLRGNGISIEKLLISARIEDNVLNAIEGSGITTSAESVAGSVVVLRNELINIGSPTREKDQFEFAAIYLQHVFTGAVCGNTVSQIGTKLERPEIVAGIRADSCLEMRISDNTVVNIGAAAGFPNLAAGVLVMGPLLAVEIADNRIRRQQEQLADDDQSNWQSIRILGAAEGALKVGMAGFDKLSFSQQVGTIDQLAAAGPKIPERAGIHGNALDGYGRSAAAEVVISGSCRFSDNEVSLLGKKVVAAVEISAETIIASANRVECGSDTRSFDLKAPGKTTFTVLGNIVGGPIMVNGATLAGTPWQPLNVMP